MSTQKLLNSQILNNALDIDVVVLETIDSTNTFAKKNRFNQDTLVITQHQSAGRGRYDRKFYSPKNEGVYFSLVLNNLTLDAQLYTIVMALAITEVFKDTSIKWLNDIIYKNKKLGGILCEGVIQGQSYKQMIIGVGINLHNLQIPDELQDIMISYYDADKEYEVNELVIKIIHTFFGLIDRRDVIELYKQKCISLNKTVCIENEIYTAVDINEKGYLICLDRYNNPREIISQEIAHVIQE